MAQVGTLWTWSQISLPRMKEGKDQQWSARSTSLTSFASRSRLSLRVHGKGWQRGAGEFAVWIGDGTTDTLLKATYKEFKFLANTFRCMMNTKGSRTCRMGRTYRHCR